jgi:polyisoprenoid-binding protein YceI
MTTANGNDAGAAGQVTRTALAGPTSWQLDAGASAVRFGHKTMWGLVTVRGEFTDLSGSAEILADGSAHGRLEIGAASVNTKNRKRDQHLRSADFFHVGAHPTIVVYITRAASTDGAEVQASGMLTVAGRTRPVTVTAIVTEATDQGITLTAETEIDRFDFGMTWNQFGMVKGPAHMSILARFVRPATA